MCEGRQVEHIVEIFLFFVERPELGRQRIYGKGFEIPLSIPY